MRVGPEQLVMTETEYARKLDEVDRLLNDPDIPIDPARIWSLLADIAERSGIHSDVRQAGSSGSV